MPHTMTNTTYDSQGNVVKTETVELPDTKVEKAIALINSVDPNAVTTLAQARTVLIAMHTVLKAIVPYVSMNQVYDE